ncbi:protein serine/threonine phosphatase 2C [Dendrothele bispora CBS 962.96]|uniref:Protein serine/threonine phosphatase 2C n=1 Tax=Dendrothele bispora (strain CBS 962.96) TaxID=1314807 RepID=A0A4S8MQ43_DENBC|nr:protein serine/threonine phosphatase 2C [Dendrothele bispora CBS 962.96]
MGARPSVNDPSKNAHSKPLTVSTGTETFGTLNQIPSRKMLFDIGVHEAQGERPTMEDTHAFIVDFDSVEGQLYAGVYDGHGNRNVSQWLGNHFHEHFLECIHDNPDLSAISVLNETFTKVDNTLKLLSETTEDLSDAGSTAVVAFLRLEDQDGSQTSFTMSDSRGTNGAAKSKLKAPSSDARRVLYVANAGDARGVLSRKGTAVRLTKDHKPTDENERERICDAGGIVIRGRVFGTLAVSRSLGDHLSYDGLHLKDFVIGIPHTSKTVLNDGDEYCIMACDGLWDVISDQEAVDLIRNIPNAQKASEKLVEYALKNDRQKTQDNVTVMVIRFDTGSQ